METSSSIKKMFVGNKIIVPRYQRAYSWETPIKNSNKQTHTDVFLSDLEQYKKSIDNDIKVENLEDYIENYSNKPSFYFGHFLFETISESEFHIIDGQQRLTTIVIFLSTLFKKLLSIRDLSDEEEVLKETIIKRKSKIKFVTVDYDNLLFKDYVITQDKTDKKGLKTESAKRIVRAFDFFEKKIVDKDIDYLVKMLGAVSSALCTTHQVKNESEAIQMFIFQNNRGKRPSNLEIIKAEFLYKVHLNGKDEKEIIIKDIKERFQKIYQSISAIEYRINEDDVLLFTLRVYFNSLKQSSPLSTINEELKKENSIEFITSFTKTLATSFEYLSSFFVEDEQKNIHIHSLVTLGGLSIALPFIIKAYKFGLEVEEINKLCNSLESLVLRNRIIGTRADMVTRMNDVFKAFTSDNSSIEPIVIRINWMKVTTGNEWWWAYWNNDELRKSLQGKINHSIARYLLWKYENHLKTQEQSGYNPQRYDLIEKPELEHIAPRTEPSKKRHGYGKYDDAFRNQYLDCLGNYLLISKSHNSSVGNIPFPEKYKTYTHLKQQDEVRSLVAEKGKWDKTVIESRKQKIITFIMDNF